MSVVLYRLRAEARARWRAWLGLALIAGLVAGAAIAAAAGARRTDSAYPRFVVAQDGFHALTGGGAESAYDERFEAIRRLPEVRDSSVAVFLGASAIVPAAGGERRLGLFEVLIMTDPDGRIGYETHRAKVLRGRMPDRSVADEVAISFAFADALGVGVGDTIRAGLGFDFERFSAVREVPVRVAGVVATPSDFEAVGQQSFPTIYATPAMLEAHRDVIPPLNPDTWNLQVHLKGGPEAAYAFREKIQGRFDLDVPLIEPVMRSGVQRTMRLYAAALWIVAALIGTAGAAVIGQSLSRQVAMDSTDHANLRALGVGTHGLVALGLTRALLIAGVAAAVAGVTAFLASPLTPIGTARVAEPHPGFAFDLLAIGAGVGATLLLTVAASTWPVVRAATSSRDRDTGEARRRSLAASAAGRFVGGSPAANAGVHMALETGGGRLAVPVRTTVLAVAVGLAAVVGTLGVGRSLEHLTRTPALSGLTYDAILPGDDEADTRPEERKRAIEAFRFVEATVVGTGLGVSFGRTDAFLIGFEENGPIGFAIIEGRAPTATLVGGVPELALGPATMRRSGARLGDIVEFSIEGHEPGSTESTTRTARARVVGTVAVPPLPWKVVEPGEGGVMTIEGIRSLDADDQGGCCFVRFHPGTDLAAARTELEAAGFEVTLRTQRTDLATLERISQLPTLLALLFAALALSALVHVLVTGVRRRRRDLAILKTLGFVRSQVAAAVAWQSSAIAILSVLVGVPLGVAAGRWGWDLVAGEFGVVPVAVTPSLTIALIAPLVLVLANLIAALPGRAAARTEPAAVLRTE